MQFSEESVANIPKILKISRYIVIFLNIAVPSKSKKSQHFSTIQYDVLISKTIYRYFRYIESPLTCIPGSEATRTAGRLAASTQVRIATLPFLIHLLQVWQRLNHFPAGARQLTSPLTRYLITY